MRAQKGNGEKKIQEFNRKKFYSRMISLQSDEKGRKRSKRKENCKNQGRCDSKSSPSIFLSLPSLSRRNKNWKEAKYTYREELEEEPGAGAAPERNGFTKIKEGGNLLEKSSRARKVYRKRLGETRGGRSLA
ncbi:hypothetical protein BHM03_00047118 [Ensete ventricosum]|uniref:Uncharacterized protein n=1 Tax=Ensete ventricosum TaxID=4639 RepID=A0A445ML29_ENSVE|nr:hypothetical protein BHM03_00047118 [Ensete ventricosum]